MNRILLIVGNGLSIDLYKYLGLNIAPSSPFSFNVPDPFNNTKKLLDTLTKVRNLIKSYPSLTDFDIIQDFVSNYLKEDQEHQWMHSELRQYLSLAYSYANYQVLHRWKKGWRWEQWLRKHHESIAVVVSLNYDLTLETALQQSSFKYYRIGSMEEENHIGIPIFKPHGSCDFDISSSAISMPPQNRLRNLTFLNDYVINGRGRINIVAKEKMLEPRTESDIVLPFEFSPQTQLTWVRQGYEAVNQIAKTTDACIIVGISYQPCDRLEVDFIVDAMPSNTAIQLVDPRPDGDLESKLMTVSDKAKSSHPSDFLGDIT